MDIFIVFEKSLPLQGKQLQGLGSNAGNSHAREQHPFGDVGRNRTISKSLACPNDTKAQNKKTHFESGFVLEKAFGVLSWKFKKLLLFKNTIFASG